MNFQRWTYKKLRIEAQRLGLPCFHKMSKTELVDVLTEAWA